MLFALFRQYNFNKIAHIQLVFGGGSAAGLGAGTVQNGQVIGTGTGIANPGPGLFMFLYIFWHA